MSVILVVEFASLVLQDDILLPPCPVATEELFLCLHVDKKAFIPQVTQPFGCCRHNRGMSMFLESGTIVAWMAPEEVSAPTKKHAIRREPPSPMYPRHPCTRSRIEVEAQLRRFSTVLDVVNRVVEIRRTPCTRADSESVSDCDVPSRFDRECQDL